MAVVTYLETPLSNNERVKILFSDEPGVQSLDTEPEVSVLFKVYRDTPEGTTVTHTLKNGFTITYTVVEYDEAANRWTVEHVLKNEDTVLYTGSNTIYNISSYSQCFYLDSYKSGDDLYLSFDLNASNVFQSDVAYYIEDDHPWTAKFKGNISHDFSGGATDLFDWIYIDNPKTDPYDEGGHSGTGGGTGTFSGTGDQIAIPSLPTLSAVDAGFITLFNPTAAQMSALASYMWTNPLFDLENWRKIFANPMDAILGLSIVPVNVPSAGAREVKVGNISTGISMTAAASQYVEVDCGTLNVQEFWGAYLDYEPYTTAEIYLPYCGTHAIKVDDIMGKSVHVVYHVDVLSGGCCCYVQCGGTVLYTFLGHCSVSIPVTGDNWTRVVNGAIQIAGSVGTMVATGGASFGTGVPNIAAAAGNMVKPAIEKSGAMGGPGGILAVQTPYLILTRPRQALPEKQNSYTGYPSFITETLGNLEGYTKVYAVHLEDIPATDSEITEIENLLKGGVIF